MYSLKSMNDAMGYIEDNLTNETDFILVLNKPKLFLVMLSVKIAKHTEENSTKEVNK